MRLSSLLSGVTPRHHHSVQELLRSYQDEVVRLRAENEQLRRSAQAFGELAERLNLALKERETALRH